jgi:microcystin-dependent protein
MPWATKTHTFSPSTIARSSEVNDNFDDMVDQLNVAAPSGVITLWSGSIASIPSGWYLCDGNNSTPNLRDRFVVGAGSSYAVGDTGGEATHVLTVGEMPAHKHALGYSFSNGTVVSEVRSGDTSGASPDSSMMENTGGGAAHENRPPYYALAYMMKS